MAKGTGQELNPPEMRQLATTYRNNAQRCRQVGDYLKDQTNGMFWQSPAASGFEQNMAKYKKLLADLDQQMTKLSTELAEPANYVEAQEAKR